MEEMAIVAAGLVAALYIAWNLGANDAANPTDMAVGSGALSIREAVILFAAFAAMGALAQGYMVMKTLGRGVVSEIDPLGALSASLATGLWITLATWKGLPVSTTHSSVGAVLGYGVAKKLLGSGSESVINLDVVTKVFVSWLLTPVLAITFAASLYFAFSKLTLKLQSRSRDVNKLFKYLLIFNLAFSAYAFGANDVGNATGVYVAVVSDVMGTPDRVTMLYLAALGSAGIALGGFTWGYRVIRTVGFRITRLDYVSGAAGELSNALVVWLFTTVPKLLFGWGMPISTTHASVGSVIGVGIAKSRSLRGVNVRTIAVIFAGWGLTVPVAAGLSIIIYSLASSIMS